MSAPDGMQLDRFSIYTESSGVWRFTADDALGARVAVANGEGKPDENLVIDHSTILITLGEQGRDVTCDSEATIGDLRDAIDVLQAILQAHEVVR